MRLKKNYTKKMCVICKIKYNGHKNRKTCGKKRCQNKLMDKLQAAYRRKLKK